MLDARRCACSKKGARRCFSARQASPIMGIADLVHLLQWRQTTHHVMVDETAQRLEADVPESSVPAPGRLGAPRRQTHWAPDL